MVALTDNLGGLLRDTIVRCWDLPAFSEYQGSTISYGDVAREVEKIHTLFRLAGVQPGERVALADRNSPHWAVAYIATLTYGAVIVPVLHEFKTHMMHHIVTHSDARILFVSPSVWEELNEAEMPQLQAVVSLATWDVLFDRYEGEVDLARGTIERAYAESHPEGISPARLDYHPGTGEELAEINYTSGTSGFSKGVMQPYRALLSNMQFAEGAIDLQPGDNVISILPMAHAYGQAFEFLSPFLRGCHIHFLTRMPSPKVIMGAFREIKPRIILMVPLIVEKIYKQQVLKVLSRPRIRFMLRLPIIDRVIQKRFHDALTETFGGNFIEIIVGGAALNHEVELFLKKIGFRYTVGYGMTECAPIITYASWDSNRLYSTGRIVPNMELRIAEPDAEGVGEIQVRGANLMQGYYKRPDLTAEVFTPDGWLRTGDLGTVDDEGFVYIRGRRKNMILGPSGQNIYPEEIEGLLNTMSYVQESLVVERDGRLVALIVPDFAAADAEGLSPHTIEAIMEDHRKELNQELPAFSQLQECVLYPEEFEKTPKKSIKRFLYEITREE